MMFRVAVVFVVVLFSAGCAGPATHARESAPDPLFGLGERDVFRIRADGLDRDFHVLVRLPRSYRTSDRSYPMVLLLDGGILFPMLSPYQLMMEVQGSADEVILVGISYGGLGFSNGNLRGTDYTAPSPDVEFFGGADAFQEFLAVQLLPRLDSDYRIDAERRVVLGQSLGGQFAIYSALTRPELFDVHVAVNPALHANLAFFLERIPSRSDSGTTELVVALGSEEPERFRVPITTWLDRWRASASAGIRLDVLELDGGHHATSAPSAYFEIVTSRFPDSD